jgi:hypothetical protein
MGKGKLRSGFLVFFLVCVSLLTGCDLPQVSAEERLFLPLAVEFLGAYQLPSTKFQDTPVGGLSGITYDRPQDLFYAVSDDRSDRAPARFYTLKMELDETTPTMPKIKTIAVQAVTTLKQKAGEPYAKGTIDPEGIALSPLDSVFISSEGAPTAGLPPFIGEFDRKTGVLKRTLPLPAAFLPSSAEDAPRQGVQNNLALEALTLNAGATKGDPFNLFTATEGALLQDQTDPNPEGGTKVRMVHYYVQPALITLLGEHLYELDPKPQRVLREGLSELLAIDQAGHFIALERSLGLTGFTAKLFQTTSGTASDTSRVPSFRGTLKGIQPMRKQLLLDLQDLNIRLDNLEGMTLGPRLSDGSQSLLLVSDDNFQPIERNQFLLFRLKGSA